LTADRVGLRRAAHAMPFGAELLPAGGTRFRLWAPSATSVELELQGGARTGLLGLQRIADGWHEILVPEAGPGARYRFLVGTNSHEPRLVPDPASRFNPDGVHGPSEVIDPREYAWDPGNDAWRGRPWEEAVIYELHVGTFTVEGTYASALRRLPQLVDLGITALQIMPLAAFAGSRNWGYDGVLPYATANCYGGPLALKALIDGAHSLSLMVFLDVVYNHFGPDSSTPPTEHPGAPPSTSTAGRAARCAIFSSTTRFSGSANTASTDCGSTPSTHSAIRAHPTLSARLRARCARVPAASAMCT
jgi:1,4-alpha-glucan branching enzyme